MPDIPDRDDQEAAYAKLIAKLLKAYGGRLLEKLGDPPDLSNLDQSFWDEEAKELVKNLSPFGEQVFLDAALRLMETTPLGVDWALVNERAVEWASRYTYDLVRGINQTTRGTLQRTLTDYFNLGLTREDLEGRIRPLFGPVRAEMIAVTEVTRAASEGEQALARELHEQGIDMIPVWQTNNDELVCPQCGPKHDQPIRDDIFPPEHPRCILPGNEIVAPGPISAATKSFYNGLAIEIRLASGRNLTVTPNHPILTSRGWVAAQSIKDGDYALGASNPKRMLDSVYPHNDNRPAAIEQVFGSLKESGGMSAGVMPVSSIDFHGDGRFIDGNIDIVYVDRLLLDDVCPVGGEPVSQDDFSRRYVCEFPLESLGVPDFVFNGLAYPADGGVSMANLPRPLFGTHLLPLKRFRLGLGARLDAIADKPSVEGVPTDTRLAREFILRFAGYIAPDKIIGVREFDFSGHVYDLQCNDYELYICNGIITHNCRCWVVYELPEVTR